MPSNVSGRRYAQAIFEISKETGDSDIWISDLERLSFVFSMEEVQEFLQSPKISLEEKDSFISENLKGLSDLAMNVASLLVRKNRASLAQSIFESYQEMVDEEKGIVSATLTAAVPMKKDLQDKLEKFLSDETGVKLRISTNVDPDLIGGVVARVGDRVIDGSTRTKLKNLKGWLTDEAAR
ncbi:MAG: ATP synthase F1 subunit delta [Dehalococcoidia bacterium]